VKEVDTVTEYVLVIFLDSESLVCVHSPQPLLQLFNDNILLHGWSLIYARGAPSEF
jgi:hypothetical protein